MPKKNYRAYLLVRSKTQKADATAKLRARIIADKRDLETTLPLLVSADFAEYYQSNGQLRVGKVAHTYREIYEKKCVKAAYKAACRVAEYMLGIDRDYWRYCTKSHFSHLITAEYYSLVDRHPQDYIAGLVEADAHRQASDKVEYWREYLDDWRYQAGVAPEPPRGLVSRTEWIIHMEAAKANWDELRNMAKAAKL